MNTIWSICDNEGWCMPEPQCSDALFVFNPKLRLLTQHKISNLFQLSASSDTGWVNYLCRLLEELEWDTRHPGGLEDQLHIKKQSCLINRALEHHPCCQLKELTLTLSETSLRCQRKRRTMRIDFDLTLLYKEAQDAQWGRTQEESYSIENNVNNINMSHITNISHLLFSTSLFSISSVCDTCGWVLLHLSTIWFSRQHEHKSSLRKLWEYLMFYLVLINGSAPNELLSKDSLFACAHLVSGNVIIIYWLIS